MFQTVSPLERIKIFFSRKDALPRLILINIGVWLVLALIRSIASLFDAPGQMMGTSNSMGGWMMHAFALPSSFTAFLARPWTLITYMFLHFSFLHILFNMLWLWWFGVIFVQYLSQRQLLGTYLFGGIAGGLFYMIAFNIFPAFVEVRESAMALGASASVLAIVVAISFYVPNYTIHLFLLGPVKIKYIAIFSIVMDLFMLNSGNAGGHLAHLGGALWGFAWVKMLPGYDITRMFGWVNFSRTRTRWQSGQKRRKFKVYRQSGRPFTDEEYNIAKVEKQKKIDHILDKISRSGYDSLTSEEKELLFSNSKKP
ncbi:MAG: rhomboid family intramembrane serine protease [Lentimicrobium sp.]|jgi:membrane associated rhomboid family serine protease|nr:rhomboid family intramembrane serine protease [Lentimicrobium sp.]MDD2526806.1 rhomboid family intramembrane serine protease [Lentimicrobiaceae bacterium]MDD4597895.1 rhomboid family intramembrane serine protease [Lentimicrobiaceae bacterium]MDY0024419.1 rhomboid family intramembrane serine protease [Lentimicrobium sp.]HAH58170.1 rhomboid family intramembrane serine protease [Bacteroidales bacterium]